MAVTSDVEIGQFRQLEQTKRERSADGFTDPIQQVHATVAQLVRNDFIASFSVFLG